VTLHEIQPLLGVAAGVLGFIDYLIYARSVMRERTKPNAATWIGTSAVWFVTLVSYFLIGARDTLWFVIASTAGSFLVALLTVRYGVKWQRCDFVCLAGAAGVGALGFLTESPLNALCAAMVVDFLALFPTLAKTWKHPDWEEPFPWIGTVAASLLTVMAVTLPWEFEIAAYPIYLLVMNSVVLALIYRPKVQISLVSLFRQS
jgi:phosphoglycerol transferase MdoB-like AlkP superfamily enzyme